MGEDRLKLRYGTGKLDRASSLGSWWHCREKYWRKRMHVWEDETLQAKKGMARATPCHIRSSATACAESMTQTRVGKFHHNKIYRSWAKPSCYSIQVNSDPNVYDYLLLSYSSDGVITILRISLHLNNVHQAFVKDMWGIWLSNLDRAWDLATAVCSQSFLRIHILEWATIVVFKSYYPIGFI